MLESIPVGKHTRRENTRNAFCEDVIFDARIGVFTQNHREKRQSFIYVAGLQSHIL